MPRQDFSLKPVGGIKPLPPSSASDITVIQAFHPSSLPISNPPPPYPMPQGDKSSYTSKQKRQAAHIEEGYEKRGVSARTAKARAWATVNKQDGGGKKRH